MLIFLSCLSAAVSKMMSEGLQILLGILKYYGFKKGRGNCSQQTAAYKLKIICSCSYFYIFVFRYLVGLWELWANASCTKHWMWRWALFCPISFQLYRLVHYSFQRDSWELKRALSTGYLFSSPMQLRGQELHAPQVLVRSIGRALARHCVALGCPFENEGAAVCKAGRPRRWQVT